MATRRPTATAGDDALEAALEGLKGHTAAYITNQNAHNEQQFKASVAGLEQKMQASGNPKYHKNNAQALQRIHGAFGRAKTTTEKRNIAATLAGIIKGMALRKLAVCALGGVASLAVGGALVYKIATEGEVVQVQDTNADGFADRVDVDVTGDHVPDYTLEDRDYDTMCDGISKVIDPSNPEARELVVGATEPSLLHEAGADESILEGAIDLGFRVFEKLFG